MAGRLPIFVFLVAATIPHLTGCQHQDGNRILMYIGASFEGGAEVALMELRVWAASGACDDIVFEDNEVWVGWSHVARSNEYGDAFQIGERLSLDRPYIVGRDDGNLVYYSFGTLAEVADRHGNVVVTFGEGMRSGAFYTANDTMVVEGPEHLLLVDLVKREWVEMDVHGSWPSFLPGGDQLVYEREGGVYRYDLEVGDEVGLGQGRWPRALDDGRVIALRDGAEGPGLYAITPGDGGWSLLGEADPTVDEAAWWRLAPDGQRLLHDSEEGSYILQGWTGAGSGDWRMDSELVCP